MRGPREVSDEWILAFARMTGVAQALSDDERRGLRRAQIGE